MKKSIVFYVLAMVLLANFAGAEDYKVQGDFNQTFSPSQMSSENYKIKEGINSGGYVPPPPRANQLKDFTSAPFQIGKSFNEIGLTAGGYFNPDTDLKGGYYIAEANHWSEWKDAGRNISFLGAFVMYEPGEVGNYNWRKLKLLYQPAWYEILDIRETYHLLLKPRIGVSINRGTEEEENFTYGLYAELDKVFNPLNRAGIMFDSLIEYRDIGDEGQINPRLFYERGWANGNSLTISAGPIWHITPSGSNVGFTPAISARFPLDSDFALKLAVTADFTDDDKVYGGYVSLTWNDIMHVFRKNQH